MKRILITGANSYIGTSFENYIKQWPSQYLVDTVDMIDDTWHKKSFEGYDVVFHVAGIAHRKETKKNSHLYYEVNRDLAVEVAKKAKHDGVRQFVFMSSMSIYGKNTGVITKKTFPNPVSNYGKSKFQAEQKITDLSNPIFHIAILRPPMLYGKYCKGNFQSLVKIIHKFPFFPSCKNERSMIYIKNFCAFIKLIIEENLAGTFFPQNKEYVQTEKMVRYIAETDGKELQFSVFAGIIVRVLRLFVPTVKKAFGNLIYKDTEDFEYKYCTTDFKKSIQESVSIGVREIE
jgi:UDP-glucose 4-epimerase